MLPYIAYMDPMGYSIWPWVNHRNESSWTRRFAITSSISNDTTPIQLPNRQSRPIFKSVQGSNKKLFALVNIPNTTQTEYTCIQNNHLFWSWYVFTHHPYQSILGIIRKHAPKCGIQTNNEFMMDMFKKANKKPYASRCIMMHLAEPW